MAKLEDVIYKPIGTFRCDQVDPVQSPRQGTLAEGARGEIVLKEALDLASLSDVATFSHLWVLFDFNRSKSWKPKVLPPRGELKRGVFATRSPYRPNSIGMSVVELVSVKANKISVKNHDLLDGTPILDIKPYLTYADSFPQAGRGWTSDLTEYGVSFTEVAQEKLNWLSISLGLNLKNLVGQQLKFDPTFGKTKRVKPMEDGEFEFAYRTWRFRFSVENQQVIVFDVSSGYLLSDLKEGSEDQWEDKEIHRKFLKLF